MSFETPDTLPEPASPEPISPERLESLRAPFLDRMREIFAAEHLTVEQAHALLERAAHAVGIRELSDTMVADPELADEPINWRYFQDMSEVTNKVGMSEYFGLRGQGSVDYGDSSLEGICYRILFEIDSTVQDLTDAEANNNQILNAKLEATGVTRGDVFEIIQNVLRDAETAKTEDREKYAENVVRRYIEIYNHGHVTNEVLDFFSSLTPELSASIGRMSINDFINQTRGYENYTGLGNYANVFGFSEGIVNRLGREVGEVRMSFMLEQLTSLATIARIARGRSLVN